MSGEDLLNNLLQQAAEAREPKKKHVLRTVAYVCGALTLVQIIVGLVFLYLWAFEVVQMPENAGAAFVVGPPVTAFLSVLSWEAQDS